LRARGPYHYLPSSHPMVRRHHSTRHSPWRVEPPPRRSQRALTGRRAIQAGPAGSGRRTLTARFPGPASGDGHAARGRLTTRAHRPSSWHPRHPLCRATTCRERATTPATKCGQRHRLRPATVKPRLARAATLLAGLPPHLPGSARSPGARGAGCRCGALRGRPTRPQRRQQARARPLHGIYAGGVASARRGGRQTARPAARDRNAPETLDKLGD